jgi:hypothetical protein
MRWLFLGVFLAACGSGVTIPHRPDGGESVDGALAGDGGSPSDGSVRMDGSPRDGAGADDAGHIDAGATACVCSPGSFCEPVTCGGIGPCMPRPTLCPGLVAPVCGCDGASYPNDCARQMAGVGKAHDGQCGMPDGGLACSLVARGSCCFTDRDCTLGSRCYKASCTTAGEGRCEPAPATGKCWVQADCATGICTGGMMCPCGAACAVADIPGSCL